MVGRRFGVRALTSAVLVIASALWPAAEPAGAATACDPFAPPSFRGVVPTAQDVLGFSLGDQEVTTDQAWTYLDAVDAASDRVVSGTYATSVQGRPLRYAIVGRKDNVTPGALASIAADIKTIRDPSTPADQVAALAATTPELLYVAGNVHGTEESGADAALRVLYELADRNDCAATQILDNALVFILPIQNPDGRELDTRRNAYGDDMNRDWFARTQPETDGKVELLRQYPPQLFVDAHEFGYYRSFFPPDDDPIYHEVSDQVLGWIDGLYGPALEDLFNAHGWGYFHGGGYDFFMPGYGDTVPADGFQAAGITLETYNGAPIALRVEKNFDEFWILVSQASLHHDAILIGQHDAYVQAVREGRRGTLEPNAVYRYGGSPRVDVPTYKVRSYFFSPGVPAHERETLMLVRMLQRMDVQVYQLDAPLPVPKFRPYEGDVGPVILPAGTYWVPMAQPQKHWIQAMLNRDTYEPVKATYDVSGWSLPLMFGLTGGSAGAKLTPTASLVDPVGDVPGVPPPADPPTLGIFQLSKGVYSTQEMGGLRYLLDGAWNLPYSIVTSAQIRRGELDGIDVLAVPGGGAKFGQKRLRPKGIRELTAWVKEGGRLVGWKYGGGLLAAHIGLIDAQIKNSPTGIEGALVRIRFEPGSPLATGVGATPWIMFEGDDVIVRAPASTVAARYPKAGAVQVSGFAPGPSVRQIAGTAAILDQPVGRGRVITFPFDPNFRLYTVDMQHVLWNALFG